MRLLPAKIYKARNKGGQVPKIDFMLAKQSGAYVFRRFTSKGYELMQIVGSKPQVLKSLEYLKLRSFESQIRPIQRHPGLNGICIAIKNSYGKDILERWNAREMGNTIPLKRR